MSVYTPQARSAPAPIFSKPKKESFPYGRRDVIKKTPLGELILNVGWVSSFRRPASKRTCPPFSSFSATELIKLRATGAKMTYSLWPEVA